MMGKVLKWIKKNGGAEGMAKRNQEKADLFYDYLDNSDFYHATAEKGSRSLMNIPFLTKYDGDEATAINKKFVAEAAAAGSDAVVADGRTLYKAVLSSGDITITKCGF
jgi:phosphoserine aminotransferase